MQEQRQNPTTQSTQTGQTGLTNVVNLATSQSHHAALRRGSVISVASGAVLVISRMRLEDTVLTVQVPLHPGGVYCVAVTGVYEIRALTDAQLSQVSAAGWLPWGALLPGKLRLGGLPQALQAFAVRLLHGTSAVDQPLGGRAGPGWVIDPV